MKAREEGREGSREGGRGEGREGRKVRGEQKCLLFKQELVLSNPSRYYPHT